jgi:prepilin-type N-terminal cleavage/methylation domain-containing protein
VRQRLRTIRHNDGGFTLTELLIVIVILGVLTGIVVFAVGAFGDRGEAAACRTDKKTVEVAVEAFYAKNNAYPAGATSADRIGALVTGKFLREPPSATTYTIALDAAGGVTASGACT